MGGVRTENIMGYKGRVSIKKVAGYSGHELCFRNLADFFFLVLLVCKKMIIDLLHIFFDRNARKIVRVLLVKQCLQNPSVFISKMKETK